MEATPTPLVISDDQDLIVMANPEAAALLGVPVDRVSVKASSGNGMTGFGRGEGVFASAVVLVEVP